jgi:general secretion pathway protein D
VRTNSVIVSATEDNMKIIEDLITRLDDKGAAVIKLKLYPLRYADATSAAKLITDTFAETSSGGGSQGSGRGGRGGGMIPIFMGGQPQAPGDVHAAKEVKAVPDVRTNSVLVAASEQNLLLIDDLMTQLDRQVNDILEVKIYKLQNADPVEMATILQALFRPQIQATQQAGRTAGGQSQQGGGNFFRQMMGMGGGTGSSAAAGGLPPSQEVEVTSDTRTRAVIVKASREYIAIMDDVVRQLDQDPTEALSTYVVPVKNHTATELAATLQNLMRSTGTGGQSRTSSQGTFGAQQLFGSRTTGNTSSRNTGGSTRSSSTRSSSTRTRNLGPIQEEGGQEAGPAAESPDEEMPRRALEGQVDVQADSTTNSLVIRTSPRNFQAIQAMLGDLDRMRPQVLIKVLIAEVTLDDRTRFGVEGFWENKMTVRGGDKATNRLGTDFPLGNQGFTYLLSGDEFQATLNAFASEGKLRVMATPRIMVLDNQTANINVGKEVPIITNSTINSLGNPVNTVQYQSVGIMLDVTPHINPDGLVTMLVAPEISDIASAAESVEITPGANSPTFNVNNASTTVAVRSGTTVVIGGLIRETTDDAVQKLPIFGDIPILGALFSNTSKIKVKRELMIFLTPYVAFTAAEIEEITELEKSRLKILDLRDIDSESDRWLERLRH